MAELEDGCEIGAGILHPEAPREALVAAYMEQRERLAALRPLEKLLEAGTEFNNAKGIDGPVLRHDEGYEAAKEYLALGQGSVDYRDGQAVRFAQLIVSMHESAGWWGRFAAHLHKEINLLRQEVDQSRPILKWASQRPEPILRWATPPPGAGA